MLVKRVIPVDEEGNEIKYSVVHSGRQYTVPVWGVRGHPRRLKEGRVTYVRPYTKGKEIIQKRYRIRNTSLLKKK